VTFGGMISTGTEESTGRIPYLSTNAWLPSSYANCPDRLAESAVLRAIATSKILAASPDGSRERRTQSVHRAERRVASDPGPDRGVKLNREWVRRHIVSHLPLVLIEPGLWSGLMPLAMAWIEGSSAPDEAL